VLALVAFVGAAVVGALGGITPRVALAQDDTSTEEANKELLAMLYDEIVNERNFEIVQDYVAPGMVEHRREGDVTYATPEEYLAALEEDFAELPPELQVEVNDQIADGDQVVNHLTMTIGDTGISANGISIFRVVDGMIVEMEEIFDEASIMMQMGMMPEMDEDTGEAG
jgi:predicted SnoaL-like aldol condensation-catalyzing enzyme